MTSTTGTDEHPEVAEISALTEGVLPPGRSADVRGHLSGCPLCADVRDSLEEIRELLGTLPGPPRMPADVAGRIDAALAAEAVLASAQSPAVSSAVSRETAEDTKVTEMGSDVSRETAATRAAEPKNGRPAGHAPGAGGPGRDRRGRRRWRKGLLASVSAAAALGLGGVLVASLQSDSGNGGSQAGDAAAGAEADAVHAQVKALLADPSASVKTSPGKGGDGAEGNRPMFGTTSTTPSCVLDGIDRSEQPLAAEKYKYRGTASYLVVLAHPSDTSRVDAYVVDASCTAASPSRPGKVLLEETYTRRP